MPAASRPSCIARRSASRSERRIWPRRSSTSSNSSDAPIQVTPNGGATSLTLVTWFDTMPAGSLRGLVLGSSDLQRDCDELAAKGVEFDQPLQERPWGAEAVIRDPDGNAIVLQQA